MSVSAREASTPGIQRGMPAGRGPRLFQLLTGAPVVVAVVWILATRSAQFADFRLLFWVAVIGIVELLPVQGWRDLRLTLGEPLLDAFAFIFPPPVALVVAFVAAMDMRELRREIGLLRAVFNRAQIALAVVTTGVVFHAWGGSLSSWANVIPLALLAAVLGRVVNMALVAEAGALAWGMKWRDVIRKMRIGSFKDTLFGLVALGVLAALVARLYVEVDQGYWAVLAFLVPLLVLGREAFRQLRRAEAEADELRAREGAFRALSQRIASEREDERSQIAGALHDDVITKVMHLNLLANAGAVAIRSRDPLGAAQLVDEIRQASASTLGTLRNVISEVRESPMGRKGLATALHQLSQSLEAEGGIAIQLDLRFAEISSDRQVLLYQIAREALHNAIRHSSATEIRLRLESDDAEWVELEVEDNGTGFDPDVQTPDHFGVTLIQERARVLGTEATIRSGGHGTSITVRCRAES